LFFWKQDSWILDRYPETVTRARDGALLLNSPYI